MENSSKKLCLVTGGNRGFGLAMIRRLLKTGKCSIILGTRNTKKTE